MGLVILSRVYKRMGKAISTATKMGDICVLLSEKGGSACLSWQRALKKKYGDFCTTPLHFTCQCITLDGEISET
jgi:hypothetical protein